MRRSSALVSIGIAVILLVAAAAFALARRDQDREVEPRADRPALMLLTTLPILFPEEFTLEASGSKALTALETRYTVIPIGTTDSGSLRQGRILLMAHPLAQPAEALVDLDRWVRDGGRVLLLADPRLEWPSKRPLGDRLRPPPSFADTGLLAHWGLRLDDGDEAGSKRVELAGRSVQTVSPGTLAGTCEISENGFAARCRIGKGRATVIADADFINVEQLDVLPDRNLDALLAELAALER